jgi:hypothetical protein
MVRSTLLSATVLAVGLATSAPAQTGVAPAYPPVPASPTYPPAPSSPAYAPAPTYPPPPGAPVPSYVPPTTAAPPGANPQTGARPGNEIGTGMSMPMGNSASNINGQDTRSEIAPNLPSPELGPNASPVDYLRAAQGALLAGRTGEAQQALEQAQTRLLDRSVSYGQTSTPSDNPAVSQISQALRALAAGDRAQCMQLIQAAIPQAQAMGQ